MHTSPVAASLDILGDRWTLVVLRDLLVGGRSHFADFAGDESIATNTLAHDCGAFTMRGSSLVFVILTTVDAGSMCRAVLRSS